MIKKFDYMTAYSRNLGWVSEWEQYILKHKKIAIAGLGGVGGIHLLTLCRLGITKFNIADPDTFGIENINRQIGACMSSVGKSKSSVLEKQALDINPQLTINKYAAIDKNNVTEFLDGVDLYIDGIDIFCPDVRELIFNTCTKKSIPAITAGPLGMGSSFMIFMPGEMTFSDYFCFNNSSFEMKMLKFMVGLSPKAPHVNYLVERDRVDIKAKKGPSTIMACQLCAGIAATESLKVLLQRGKIYSAPYIHCYDAYLNKYYRTKVRFGNKGLLQRLKLFVLKRMLKNIAAENNNTENKGKTTKLGGIEQIIELARYAPSGDNCQPWRFSIISDSSFKINFTISEKDDVYNHAGIPNCLALGCLLETIKIAATGQKKLATWNYKKLSSKTALVDIHLEDTPSISKSDLYDFIKLRSVNRDPYKYHTLSENTLKTLSKSVDDNFMLMWMNSLKQRRSMISLNLLASEIRLTIPETYPIHKSIVHFDNYNADGIPIAATGLSHFSQTLMKWAIKKWSRIKFLNKYLFATLSVKLELDIIPGIFSSSYCILMTEKPHKKLTLDQQHQRAILVGMQFQRLWLTATRIGLVLQPNYTPITFSYYHNTNKKFTVDDRALKKSAVLAEKIQLLFPDKDVLMIARIGLPRSRKKQVRSLRLSLDELILK